jgi:hypothetical protein
MAQQKGHNHDHAAARAIANGDGDGDGGGLNLSGSDGELPDVIATLNKRRPMMATQQQQQQQQQQPMHPAQGWNGHGGNGGRIAYRGDDETLDQDTGINTTNYQRGAVGIGDQLSVMDILHIGVCSVLGCVTQCKPMGAAAGPNASAAPPVPGVITPFANDDTTVGALTLMTVEREEEERQRNQGAAMCGTGTPDRYQTAATRMKAIAPQQVVDNFFVDKQQSNKEEDAGKKVERKRAATDDGDESDSDCDSIFGTIGCHFVPKPASRQD